LKGLRLDNLSRYSLLGCFHAVGRWRGVNRLRVAATHGFPISADVVASELLQLGRMICLDEKTAAWWAGMMINPGTPHCSEHDSYSQAYY